MKKMQKCRLIKEKCRLMLLKKCKNVALAMQKCRLIYYK